MKKNTKQQHAVDQKHGARIPDADIGLSQVVWMPNTLRGFTFSKKQDFPWADFANVFRHAYPSWPARILRKVECLNTAAQERFWKGKICKTLLQDVPPKLASQSPKCIVEYCRIKASEERAFNILTCKARREQLSNTGTVRFGDVRLDEQKFALRAAERTGNVRSREMMSEIILRAYQNNDNRFFIRLGKALAVKVRPEEVDWSNRCDKIAIFMVENWCGEQSLLRLPPLCIFTDHALANFCELVFPAAMPTEESIRQWRKRLGLKRPIQPKIKSVTVTEKEILFA